VVYRLKNLFGKWCQPNYNSVTATFCHNIANNLPIQISAPENEVDLTYIDDVVSAFKNELSDNSPGFRFAPPLSSRKITLGTLSELIYSFNKQRKSLLLPDFSDQFVRNLYGTYLSYLNIDDFSYTLDIKSDNRGSLAELLKSPYIGQVFISRTLPGITRGNHYHHTKTEKFMVVQGQGIIRFRDINNDEVIEYPVDGSEYKVVDIPPGYTHSIENVGNGEMVTIFWAVEIFNQDNPDTYFEIVLKAEKP
jgi:UDP-2-acetamido-2,6-beta-L-arabino-hexul-4-ose reductase